MAKKKKSREVSAKKLEKGMEAASSGYEKILGRWWVGKAADDAHRQTYKHAAKWTRRELPAVPDSILDYACGAGHLLKRLRKAFPAADLIGYDGAAKLLKKARKRLDDDPGLELTAKMLPDLDDPHPPVDLTVLCLPHLLPFDDGEAVTDYADQRRTELEAARKVVDAMREAGLWEVEERVEWQVGNVLFERMVARHLRLLTRPGGHCVRIDYTEAAFDDIDAVYQDYLRFSQGSCTSVCGVRVPRFFAPITDTYRISDIISDVSDQTDDYDSEDGGYMIRLFAAAK
jgi:SAM-dependent methyltransferase